MLDEGNGGKGTRVARRRTRTREAILTAAERAFTAEGYRGMRMEEVAERADVSVGSIYGHFGNKDGLYLALVERAVDQFAGYMERAYRAGRTPLEQVLAAGDGYLRFHLEHPGSFRFLAFDGVETRLPVVDDTVRARVGERLSGVIGAFEARIAAAIEAGEVDPAVDPRLAGRFLWGAWNGVVALGLRTDGMALTDDEIAQALQLGRRIVNDGLTNPPHRGEGGYSRAQLRPIAD